MQEILMLASYNRRKCQVHTRKHVSGTTERQTGADVELWSWKGVDRG